MSVRDANISNAAISNIEMRLELLRLNLLVRCSPLPSPYPAFVLFFSVTDGDDRAHVLSARGTSFEEAWGNGKKLLIKALMTLGLNGDLLRIDYVSGAEAQPWVNIRYLLSNTKRNYFRFGISVDCHFQHAFTEQELNANAMLYGGNAFESAVLNENNFRSYNSRRYADERILDFSDKELAYIFTTKGVFSDKHGKIHTLDNVGLNSGRRSIDELNDDVVRAMIEDSSIYLAKQVKQDGRFVYGYHPCFDREISTYNCLRHASTTYSMIEAWEVTRDTDLMKAIDRSLTYLMNDIIKIKYLDDGTDAAFLVEANGEIKLGANAVAILALTKYMEVTRTGRFLQIAHQLACGICYMQNKQDGSFTHVLNYPDLSIKETYRVIYYDGEAAFALMRLYSLTKDPQWIFAVKLAFEHFIANDYWKYHDHWLAYCTNELTRYEPDEKYFKFGLNNVADYLSFISNRRTTFPTLLELMMATYQLITRMLDSIHLRPLLKNFDLIAFQKALEKRAHYLLNGHFWPEMAMYFANPKKIVGSFYIRHHAFRVRIDDVEHYLSGFVAYSHYLTKREGFLKAISPNTKSKLVRKQVWTLDKLHPEDRGWNVRNLAAVTGGKWTQLPPKGWMASGLSTYRYAMKTGNLAVLRGPMDNVGILAKRQPILTKASGFMVTDTTLVSNPKIPVLQVVNNEKAVLAMGNYARSQMTGKLIGVTGSAGKTTMVAMLKHTLGQIGNVSSTEHNANSPVGAAWNLASIPWDNDYIVLELAIGRMSISSKMARPNVAVFTNVHPAHLENFSTTIDIARMKSFIFSGMLPNSVAVLYREMLEWDTVDEAAQKQGLNVITFGQGLGCDFQLVKYEHNYGRVHALHHGKPIVYNLRAGGVHMALNSLATLAVLYSLGHDVEEAALLIKDFAALSGRGEQLELQIGAKNFTLIDDAYNANLGSMTAALKHLDCYTGKRCVLVLGEMSELSTQSDECHRQLIAMLNETSISKVYAVGRLYNACWEKLSYSKRGAHMDSLEALMAVLLEHVEDGDVVLIKGSHVTGMHNVVNKLKSAALVL